MQGREAKFKTWVVESLLKAMIRIALEGGQSRIFENYTLVRMGQK